MKYFYVQNALFPKGRATWDYYLTNFGFDKTKEKNMEFDNFNLTQQANKYDMLARICGVA